MRHIIVDVETDGLLGQLSTVHALVLRDLDSERVISCTDAAPLEWYAEKPDERFPIAVGLRVMADAERVYMHNGIRFDYWALKKVFPTMPLPAQSRIKDTMVIAQMRWAHIKPLDFARVKKLKMPGKLAGSHSLEAWGYRLGLHKGDYAEWCVAQGLDPWATWRPEMSAYCEQDTAVTKALVLHIRNYGVSAESVETEHEVAWYLFHQEQNGWPFDVDGARSLQAKLAARRQVLAETLRETFGSWLKFNGVTDPKRDNKKKGVYAGAPYSKLKEVEFNPASRDQIAARLKVLYNWEPTEFTETGKPKVDDDTLKGLAAKNIPAVTLLIEYLLVDKRLGQLAEGQEAWLNHARRDPSTGQAHVYPRVKQNHAITHRAAHSKPPIAGVPKVGKPYGEECRALFGVPGKRWERLADESEDQWLDRLIAARREGADIWVQVGADASGLELRCLAHYMARYDDGAYGRTILLGRNEDGTDIHSVNMRALGLSGKEGRDLAKTFIYAFLYGAGDELIGALVCPFGTREEKVKAGKKLKKKFLKGLPALGALLDAVKEKAGEPGYLTLIDGRRTYIRSEHSALNSLLQSCGAIICKRWILEFNRRLVAEIGPQGWDGNWAALGWIHDEVQLAVRPEHVATVKRILVESIRAMTAHFSFRIPLDGEAKTGLTWAECH